MFVRNFICQIALQKSCIINFGRTGILTIFMLPGRNMVDFSNFFIWLWCSEVLFYRFLYLFYTVFLYIFNIPLQDRIVLALSLYDQNPRHSSEKGTQYSTIDNLAS